MLAAAATAAASVAAESAWPWAVAFAVPFVVCAAAVRGRRTGVLAVATLTCLVGLAVFSWSVVRFGESSTSGLVMIWALPAQWLLAGAYAMAGGWTAERG